MPKSIKLIPAIAIINAVSAFVITLDKHPRGAAAFIAVLLAGGLSIAIAKRRKPCQHEKPLPRKERHVPKKDPD